jgi:CubicO group peptidase (beta-lactamase class C family)
MNMENRNTFKRVIDLMETTLDKKGNHLNIGSIIISDENEIYEHNFKDDSLVDIRSVAKPIVCLALGSAIEKGLYFHDVKLDLHTPIWQFLSEYSQLINANSIEKWKTVTLLDCLRITLGHNQGIMFSADIKEQDENQLVNYIVNYPMPNEIGNHFVYSNAGTFLISTLITELLGKNLDEFVNEYIFLPLGILEYSWKKFGKYCAGCTGLKLYNKDLHKIGKLLINNGNYQGNQIVPLSWIEKMRTSQVPHPTHRYIAERAFPKWSYGLNLWICEDGNYYCDGTDGQYLICIPNKNIVISTTGFQSDTEPISNILGLWK